MSENSHLEKRYLTSEVVEDLRRKKMVFLAGPRQVGKTTLALSLLTPNSPEHPAYFNWDLPGSRTELLAGRIPLDQNLIVLDEIHKYRMWRNLVKGLYDRFNQRTNFLVTGSARLDLYSRGGDSLQGRYHLYRLHPLSLGELLSQGNEGAFPLLLQFGGFPEPFYERDLTAWRRWQAQRLRLVLRDDLVSLEVVKDVELAGLLVELLPRQVGSPISIANLRSDLGVSHETVTRWLSVLENLYVCFSVPPYGPPRVKAVKKERKFYLWDWSQCPDEGARFENLVASQLLKLCHHREDTEGHRMELRFIKTLDKREVDFVVLQDRKPLFAVECKLAERRLSPQIRYLSERTSIPQFFQVHLDSDGFEVPEARASVLSFEQFVRDQKLP